MCPKKDIKVSTYRKGTEEEYEKMLDDAKSGMFDIIYVKSISEFPKERLLKDVRELREHGVAVKFEEENIDSSFLSWELLLTVCLTGYR